MFNRISLRLMKFFVDFLYYGLPVFYWIFIGSLFILLTVFVLFIFVIVL